ncbi:hypothetical protein M9458_030021, partial [Cirrhinus mrigala]
MPGHLSQGPDILFRQGPRLGNGDSFGQVQVDLFVTQETSHCPLWFSLTHPAPLGLDTM